MCRYSSTFTSIVYGFATVLNSFIFFSFSCFVQFSWFSPQSDAIFHRIDNFLHSSHNLSVCHRSKTSLSEMKAFFVFLLIFSAFIFAHLLVLILMKCMPCTRKFDSIYCQRENLPRDRVCWTKIFRNYSLYYHNFGTYALAYTENRKTYTNIRPSAKESIAEMYVSRKTQLTNKRVRMVIWANGDGDKNDNEVSVVWFTLWGNACTYIPM